MKIEKRPQMTLQKGHKKGQKLLYLNQNQPDIWNKYCNVSQLSLFLGISERRIQQLTKVGILKKTGHGEYDLISCLQAYLRYLKRLLRRYMGLYEYCIKVYKRGKCNFENLPFYEDISKLKPFSKREFLKMFNKEEGYNGRARS